MKIKNMRQPNEEGQWGKVKAFFDVENISASQERIDLYTYPENIQSTKDYAWRTLISFTPKHSLLKRLLIQSIKRAHNKSECTSNFWYSIYTYDNSNEIKDIWSTSKPQESYTPIVTFNCQKYADPFDLNNTCLIHSHIFIESKALFAVLTGITHWNNYEVGSVFQVRRIPDVYDSDMQNYLNFLSVI